MANKVGEFFISIAVDAATGNLSVRQLVGVLGELNVASVASVGVLGKIAEGLTGITESAMAAADQLSTLQDVTGADPKIVQQWDKAAERIVHHSGVIIGAVKNVNEWMGKVALHTGNAPSELTGFLGILPYKRIDSSGNMVTKTAIDLIQEISRNGRYWSMQEQAKQQLLGGIFGSSKDDVYRVLKQIHAGTFHPEQISGLSDKQVHDMNTVEGTWTGIKQTATDIAQTFMIAGGAIEKVLEGVKDTLQWWDKLVHSDRFQKVMDYVGGSLQSAVSPGEKGSGYYDEATVSRLDQRLSARALANKHRLDRETAAATGPLKGEVDVTIRDPKGNQLGKKKAFIERGVTNREVDQASINQGNGGQGQ